MWQLQRRAWKNDLLTRLEANIAAEPVPWSPPQTSEAASREFKRVRANGHFRHEESVFVLAPAQGRPAGPDGFGYLVFTPLDTEQGTIVVNRGYVPDRSAIAGADSAQREKVTGIIRLPSDGGPFIPAPQPDRRLFFAPDIPAMAKAFGWDSKGSIVTTEYIEADASGPDNTWPKGRDPKELLAQIPNRHLEYALTWFGLAFTLLAVTLGYILRGRREGW
jgi:surfeit locus 1 family protein